MFAIGIGLPFAGTLLSWDSGLRPGENRAIEAAPEINLTRQSVEAYPEKFERYFGDHFGFRNSLVALNGFIKVRGFGDSTSLDVVIGREEFLFYAANHIIDDWRGVHPFSTDELEHWQRILEERHDWLASMGIRFVFVIAPEKSSIYPEYLPRHLARVGVASRTDQLVAHMRERSPVRIVDLRPSLLAAKQDGRLYHKTDTHWNGPGAFAGYEAIARAVGVSAIDRAELDIRVIENRTAGDLAGMLGVQEQFSEERLVAVPRAKSSAVRAELSELIEQRALLYPWTRQSEPWVMVSAEQGAPKAVVVHDSYMSGMRPYLSEHFSRIVYLYHVFEPEVIAAEQPDIVINEVIERVFSQALPANLPGVGKKGGGENEPR